MKLTMSRTQNSRIEVSSRIPCDILSVMLPPTTCAENRTHLLAAYASLSATFLIIYPTLPAG